MSLSGDARKTLWRSMTRSLFLRLFSTFDYHSHFVSLSLFQPITDIYPTIYVSGGKKSVANRWNIVGSKRSISHLFSICNCHINIYNNYIGRILLALFEVIARFRFRFFSWVHFSSLSVRSFVFSVLGNTLIDNWHTTLISLTPLLLRTVVLVAEVKCFSNVYFVASKFYYNNNINNE